MPRMLSREEARRYYDHFGAKQDSQGFYEDAAIDAMVRHGDFSSAQNVFELGCGTGRLAARLLSDHLPNTARYVGIDLSTTMVELASEKLAPFGPRAEVHHSGGGFDFTACGGPFDRFVSTYVIDLLSDSDTAALLAAAHTVLTEGGLFCAAGLTPGIGPLSKTVSALWTLVHRIRPSLVGGCRPKILGQQMAASQWRLDHCETVVSTAVASEVLIAARC